MRHPSFLRDAAERPEASTRPDIAADIDSLEDHLAEMIAATTGNLPPEMLRVVASIAAGAFRDSSNQERLLQLFGCAAPLQSDLEAFAQRLARWIDADSNPQLEARCVDFVFGFGLNGGRNQTQIGEEMGVKKATVSKRCRNLVRAFNRAPGRGMKTEAACQSYRDRQMGKRTRPPKERWAFGGLLSGVFGLEVAHA